VSIAVPESVKYTGSAIEARVTDTMIPEHTVVYSGDGLMEGNKPVIPGSYTAIPRGNGVMQISATLVNRQETTASVQIERVDTAAPTLLSTEVGADSIRFFLEDAGSGVDYGRISITDDEGQPRALLGFDEEEGSITLPYPACTLHVSIPDLRGNVLRVDLKPQS